LQPTARLETFADGVFAIAATLLIIDVSVHAPGEQLGRAILDAWPSYAAYAVSFVTIGIMWINHHDCMKQIGAVDRAFMVINLLLLMCIAFVPFPTRLIADHFHDDGLRAAALTYGVTLTVTAICFNLFWFYAVHNRRLLEPDADPTVVAGISRAFFPGVPLYGSATLLALWSPKASIVLFAAVALFYVVEATVFARGKPQTS
jgi:uncharacterized membrane protein